MTGHVIIAVLITAVLAAAIWLATSWIARNDWVPRTARTVTRPAITARTRTGEVITNVTAGVVRPPARRAGTPLELPVTTYGCGCQESPSRSRPCTRHGGALTSRPALAAITRPGSNEED